MAVVIEDKKQKLLLEYTLSDRASFVKLIRIMKPSYFDPPLDRAVEYVGEFFTKHHDIPNLDIIEAETGISFKEVDMTDSDRDYLLEEMEGFCQESAMIEAVNSSVDLIDERRFSEVIELCRKALMVRLEPSLGLDFFDNPLLRIENSDVANEPMSCGIAAIDDLVGPSGRGELGIVYAVSSGGKSIALANIAKHMASRGKHTLVVSLELNERLYAKRLDAILTGVDIQKIVDQKTDVVSILERAKESYASLTLKKMKFGTSTEDIRVLLMEYHLYKGHYPDVLIVDYLGLMGISSSMSRHMNKFDQDEIKAFGLRDILLEFNMYGYSAGQINRDGYDVKDINPSHCAGGLSVINASDWAVGLVATEEDKENSQVQAVQLKIRNNGYVSPKVIYRDPGNLRMSSTPNSKEKLDEMSKPKESVKKEALDAKTNSDKLKKALAGATGKR